MIRTVLLSRFVDRLLRLLLAGVFVYAAVPKLLAPGDFAVVIGGYGLTPVFLDPVLAVALPAGELVLAIMLLLDVRGSISAAMLLLAGFSMVLGYGIYIGLDVDCGCFGSGDPEGAAYHGLREALIRDLLLIGCCGWLAVRRLVLYNDPGRGKTGLGQTT